ncbi:cysteine desulfurase family protein [Maribacter sp. 2-571]|uniref:cysteine desulfurase family protein n=1 Tax=Maribacter sp. 2-571 TaxID=3417569 RepID=UPI003D32B2E6
MRPVIYMDYNATTPCRKEVVEAMLPYFEHDFGNPSSDHAHGWMAKDAIEEATTTIANTLHIQDNDIIYTSGATEGINMVLKGLAFETNGKKRHMIVTSNAHKAVLDCCGYLEEKGFDITYLPVDSQGLVSLTELEAALRSDTLLVSILYANNETGMLQPLSKIGELVHANNSLLFSDATQALGKVSLTSVFEHSDFACFSAHKVYGPKGIGWVYRKPNENGKALPGFIHGGGQQNGQRGGTLNTPLIIGMAKAIFLAQENLERETKRISALRDFLEEGLLQIDQAISNSTGTHRLPNTLNVSFPFVDGSKLLTALGLKVAVSNGSACKATSVAPSHVLSSMGIPSGLAMASIRCSLGLSTTSEEVKQTLDIITTAVERQRADNILWEQRYSKTEQT